MAKGDVVVPGTASDPTHPLSGPGWERRRSDACRYECDASKVPAAKPNEQVLTEQHHKDSCDINFLMARYENVIPEPNHPGFFADFTGIGDAFAARQLLDAGREAFMTLPAKVRARFDNDAAKFLDFFNDPKNKDEAVSLGLLKVPEPEKIMKVEVTNPQPVEKK